MKHSPFKALRKALDWRDELFNGDECSIFGHVDSVGPDDYELVDLVRLVSIDGVECVVPIDLADLSDFERTYVYYSADNVADKIREAEAEDRGYDG